MKITLVTLVLVLCGLVSAELKQDSNKLQTKQENNGDIKEEKSKGREEQQDIKESGSSAEVEMDVGSAESGSVESGDEEDESKPRIPASKPMKYFGFQRPVTITPMEPLINKQKACYRGCFFCFPRGRVGRVQMTAPGGPYLLNGFGPMNGFGMGYPDMGFPTPAGPVYPSMNTGYPAMGGFGGGWPCFGGPFCGGWNPNNGPMTFDAINEEEPKAPAVKINDKHLKQTNKGSPQAPNKPVDPSPNKVLDKTSPKQASNKVASD